MTPTDQISHQQLLRPSPAWVAWRCRHGQRWERVAAGQSEAEASARLFAAMAKQRSGAWSTIVLPIGEQP